MPRYRLTIAYDGSAFCGWQKQEPPAGHAPGGPPLLDPRPAELPPDRGPSATPLPGRGSPVASGGDRISLRTVQAVVERAVREVVREPVVLQGASRTDSGVHARGQVAAFSCSGDASDPAMIEPGSDAPGSAAAGPSARSEPILGSVPDIGSVPSGVSDPVLGAHRGAGWPIERGCDRLVRAINGRLPDDVLVVGAEAVGPAFDPITDCAAKAYSYTLHVSPTRPLWDRAFVQHIWTPLDLPAMSAAAARLVGEHDFAAFAAAGHGRRTTVRTILSCAVSRVAAPPLALRREIAPSEFGLSKPGSCEPGSSGAVLPPGERIRIDVAGSGFLYNMVRIIAGTLVEVGRGRLTPDGVSAALASGDRRRAGPTMPARGLCLEWIRYGGSADMLPRH